MSAELAGLLPTQKPGKVSKIPTFISPPYVAADGLAAAWLPLVATVEIAIAVATATPTRRNTRERIE
jgi:hypothetical protein